MSVKTKMTLLTGIILGVLISHTLVLASENGKDVNNASLDNGTDQTLPADTASVEVGNKICPVSGEAIGDMGGLESMQSAPHLILGKRIASIG